MKIIVGLGNPGDKYERTRHNAGFMLLDKIAQEKNLNWRQQKKFSSQVCEHENDLLVKPLTYMNNSGWAIRQILSYYKLLPRKIFFSNKNSDLSEILTVIHDDSDLELGNYKISTDSRSAGHNGVNSLIKHLKTQNFRRIRIGISTPQRKAPLEKYVLEKFSSEELKTLDKTTSEIITQEL